jgi:hypothetical protein
VKKEDLSNAPQSEKLLELVCDKRQSLRLAAAFGRIWRKNDNMKWNKKFDYPPSIRSLINDQRHYDIGEEKLPSVTTILQATQSEKESNIG